MIKLIAVFQAPKGMDPEVAWDYWINTHAPGQTGKQPEVKKYTVSKCVNGFGGAERPFFGVAELWFESQEAAESAFATPQWEAVFADAANCLDMENGIFAWTEEHEIV